MSEHDFAFERRPCDQLKRSYCDTCTAVHVSERVFSLKFWTYCYKMSQSGQTNPNLTTDGLSPIRAGIFTSI
jgi:hypothetical protein